jgi:hypothetical protein
MTTNETDAPATDQVPEAHTVRLPEPPVNILDSHEETDEIPEGAKVAYLILIDHTSYQHVVGVALDEAEATEFVRLANKGRYGEQATVMPVELLALPALWKH